MTPNEQERIIEEIVTEYKKKFWNDEANLRAWILKQSIQRGEQEDWLRTALDRMAQVVREEERELIRDWAETPLNTKDEVRAKTIDDLIDFLSPPTTEV